MSNMDDFYKAEKEQNDLIEEAIWMGIIFSSVDETCKSLAPDPEQPEKEDSGSTYYEPIEILSPSEEIAVANIKKQRKAELKSDMHEFFLKVKKRIGEIKENLGYPKKS